MTTNWNDQPAAEAITPFPNFSEQGLNRIRQMHSALVPTRELLTLLFSIDAAQTDPTDEWMGFFVEAVSGQLIWDERPTGILSEQDAAWVLARFDEAPGLSVLAVLVRLLEEAHRSPSWFEGAVRQRASLFRTTTATDGTAQVVMKPVRHLRLVA